MSWARLLRGPDPLACLTRPELVARWAERTTDELASLAEPGLIAHLQRLLRVAARLGGYGPAALSEIDPEGLDLLLADILATAVFEAWDHGLEDLGEAEVEVIGARPGLCGASAGGEGVGLWVLADGRIAVIRGRQAGDRADFRHHWGGERPPT